MINPATLRKFPATVLRRGKITSDVLPEKREDHIGCAF
jgi:hypothetical protein